MKHLLLGEKKKQKEREHAHQEPVGHFWVPLLARLGHAGPSKHRLGNNERRERT